MNNLESNNNRLYLKQSLSAWNTPLFNKILKNEIESFGAANLPLQNCLTQSSYALIDEFTIIVLRSSENNSAVLANCGVVFKGIIAGCSCADDPAPTDVVNEYCELQFIIDKITAETTIAILRRE